MASWGLGPLIGHILWHDIQGVWSILAVHRGEAYWMRHRRR